MKKELIITRRMDLLNLKGRSGKYSSIRLEVPYFTKEENEKWGSLIQKEYKACGCNTGSYFMLISILFSIVFFLLNMDKVVSNPRYYLVLLFMLVVGMGLLGKLSGIITANRKLKLLVNILKRRL